MKSLSLLTMGILLSANAYAGDIRINGFATVAAGMLTKDDGYAADATYDSMTDELSFKDLSVFGLQFNADMGEGLSAVAQLVSRGTKDFKPELEWAYVSYDFTEALNFKVGRLRLPTYFYSEYLDVSYTYPWLTPPIEVYAALITSYDGFSMLYSSSLGPVDYSLQVGYGSSELNIPSLGDVAADFDLLVNFDFSYDIWSTKLVYMNAKTSISSAGLNGLQALFPDLPNTIVGDEVPDQIYGVASYLDFGTVYMGVEYTYIGFEDTHFVLNNDNRFMATTGYRFSDFTLHYSYSTSIKSNDKGMLDPLRPGYAAISDGNDVTTHTVGLRWDFHPSAAFKIDGGTTEDVITNTEADFVRAGMTVVF
ncbi:hypothetical protein HQQ94_11490 [Shewanella sp. VB17]|uniref:hypothetical protein n=1 Tax=Shewanella sp. VB17 TaxID=2739432 RepID=UPI0015649764|nr:hypothetical protein [Shewanella sp. VB17]NRD73850.1 hypothetical protein [Shewanella sp. VB17]